MDPTKERILLTALLSFSTRGYNAVGVQDICASSGITKPTLYYHFGSKRGLLSAIADKWYGGFIKEIDRQSLYKGDLRNSLIMVMSVFLNSARTMPDFTRLRLAVAFSPPESEEQEVFIPYTDELYKALRRLFSDAVSDHGNMAGRDLAYAASFIGTADAYSGLILARALDPEEDFILRVIHYFMHGIFS